MKLLEPITIRGMELRNRVVMPANGILVRGLGLRGSTEAIIDFYARRASGGVGSIIVGALPPSAFIYEEDLKQIVAPRLRIEALMRLVAILHENGARVGVQLSQANLYPSGEVRSLFPQDWVSPSPQLQMHIPFLPPGQRARQMTVEEIEAVIKRFALASARVRESGADFVEFHLAHGHLQLSYQFFTPLENRREDLYGGASSGRMRFGLECIAAIRKAVGEEYPVFVRLGATDEAPGGVLSNDAAEYANQLEKVTVDCLDVSIGISSTTEHWNYVAPMKNSPMGTYAHLAEAIRKSVDIPLVAVGRINTPDVAEDILIRGQADLVAICRQLICDPDWVNKTVTNRSGEIVYCNSCNTYCWCRGNKEQLATHCCIKTKRPGEEWERFFPRP